MKKVRDTNKLKKLALKCIYHRASPMEVIQWLKHKNAISFRWSIARWLMAASRQNDMRRVPGSSEIEAMPAWGAGAARTAVISKLYSPRSKDQHMKDLQTSQKIVGLLAKR
ncbi:unnamed protein product [Linum tenue]|uniref:Uncharacterized protein n=1 Tax=Linum tenue TaxID=586396 RepID=A0AAV0Q6F8_9ROSI|nr:unnamed protein product [Linum tenue]